MMRTLRRGLALLALFAGQLAAAQEVVTDGWDKPQSSPLNRGIPSRLFAPSAAGYPGWVMSGSTPQLYELVRLGAADRRCGSTVLRSVQGGAGTATYGFGTLLQAFRAETYRGKRVRLSAQLQATGVKGWAGMWVRVDGADRKKALAFDNMQERPLRGEVACARQAVVVDVPAEASVISLGFLVSGQGSLHVGDIRFEVVGTSVPTTDLLSSRPSVPVLDAPNLKLE